MCTQRCTQRKSHLNIHPIYSHPRPECEYVSLSMQGNVTEDAVSSGDDVTDAHSCAQAAPGVQEALPSRRCPAGTAAGNRRPHAA